MILYFQCIVNKTMTTLRKTYKLIQLISQIIWIWNRLSTYLLYKSVNCFSLSWPCCIKWITLRYGTSNYFDNTTMKLENLGMLFSSQNPQQIFWRGQFRFYRIHTIYVSRWWFWGIICWWCIDLMLFDSYWLD